jgi:hypothetical protein
MRLPPAGVMRARHLLLRRISDAYGQPPDYVRQERAEVASRSLLMPVTCSRVTKAEPTGDFAVLHGKHVDPLGLKRLFCISSKSF